MQLPCNSGLPSAVEGDQILLVDGIAKLAATSPDYIVWRFCSILEKLQKVNLAASCSRILFHILTYLYP